MNETPPVPGTNDIPMPILPRGPLLQAIADETRWQILRELAVGEPRMVKEIAEIIGRSEIRSRETSRRSAPGWHHPDRSRAVAANPAAICGRRRGAVARLRLPAIAPERWKRARPGVRRRVLCPRRASLCRCRGGGPGWQNTLTPRARKRRSASLQEILRALRVLRGESIRGRRRARPTTTAPPSE